MSDFRPCRIIRGYGTPAYGIFEVPCATIEDALECGRHMAENTRDFDENFTVARWYGEDGPEGKEYALVPDTVIGMLKEVSS